MRLSSEEAKESPESGLPATEHSLSGRVISSAAWTAGSRLAVQASSLISTAIVARLIPPSAYGLFAMALVVTNLITLIRDLGISAAVVQRRTVEERLLSTVFWANLGLSLVFAGACWAAAPAASVFFREPQVVPVLRSLSLSIALGGASAVHLGLLTRLFQFRTIAAAEIAGAGAGLACAVALAFLGKGVWALVVGLLANAAVSTAVLFLSTRWRPKLLFCWTEVRSVVGFSANLTGFQIVNYFARNADSAIIGRYLGNASLGYYQLAYSVMLIPVWGIAQQIVGRVLFPTLSGLQDDHERFGKAYLRTCAAIGLLTFPMMAGLAVVAEPFVYVMLGPKYLSVAPLLMILAPVGMIQSIATTNGHIYTAMGRTGLMFAWGTSASCVFVLSFVIGLPYGVRGVAVSYAVAVLLLVYPVFAIPFRLVGLRVSDLARALWPGLVCTVLMVCAVAGLRFGLHYFQVYRPITVLSVCSVLGALTYLGLVYTLRVPVFFDLWRIVRSRPAAAARMVA